MLANSGLDSETFSLVEIFSLVLSFRVFAASVCAPLKCGDFEKLMVIFRLKETILVYSKEHHSV